MKSDCLSIERCLKQITDMLVLNGTLVDCPGLVHGKTGIAIFFFNYARHIGNGLFEDYALDLIGETQTQLHNNSPADYETGLAGIGVGMDYLITHHFLTADCDLFEDFDRRMYRAVMYDPWQDFSLYDGLTGYGRYWKMRLHHHDLQQARECLLRIVSMIEEKMPDIPEEELTDIYCFLHDLKEVSGFDRYIGLTEKLSVDISQHFLRLGDSVIGNITRMYHRNIYFNAGSLSEMDTALQKIPDLDLETPPLCMGLHTGYAGEGMVRFSALNKTNISWMNLL